MADLAEPTASLIDKLTGEVGYDDRLVAYKVLGSSGATRLSLYRFEELVEFLDVPDGEQLLIRGGHAYLPGIDPAELQRWVRDAIGDTELAAALAPYAHDGEGVALRLRSIRSLLRRRWAQVLAAREMVKTTPLVR